MAVVIVAVMVVPMVMAMPMIVVIMIVIVVVRVDVRVDVGAGGGHGLETRKLYPPPVYYISPWRQSRRRRRPHGELHSGPQAVSAGG